MKRCEQGHFFDTSVHRRCPSCGVVGLDMNPTRAVSPSSDRLPPRPSPAPGLRSVSLGPTARPSPAAAPAESPVSAALREEPAGFRPAPETRARSVPARDGGVTVAFWHRPSRDAPAAADGVTADPVVGWLVAIDGPEGIKGRDYRVYSEGNPIGRDNHHRIAIKDESISRDVHAILTYDPRSDDNAYYIQPGGRHMVYRIRYNHDVEGTNPEVVREAVLMPTRLNPYDLLEMGKTKLLFVPLCNDLFRWEWE